jgi:hypothetical protein
MENLKEDIPIFITSMNGDDRYTYRFLCDVEDLQNLQWTFCHPISMDTHG